MNCCACKGSLFVIRVRAICKPVILVPLIPNRVGLRDNLRWPNLLNPTIFCQTSWNSNDSLNVRKLTESCSSVLSGPVLRDTARLSQRYPPIARYVVFGVATWPIGCDTPSPFSERFPHEEHAKWRCDTPPQKGYLSDTGAIPYENKANGCDTPLCDTISKGYCAIWGGISHWAAKHPWSNTPPRVPAPQSLRYPLNDEEGLAQSMDPSRGSSQLSYWENWSA